MIKSEILIVPIALLFAIIIFFSVVYIDEGKTSATDNNQVQHVQACVYEKNVISMHNGFPVYNTLFIIQNNETLDYYGGDKDANICNIKCRGNAIAVYTRVASNNEYTLDIDNGGNIIAINGVGV